MHAGRRGDEGAPRESRLPGIAAAPDRLARAALGHSKEDGSEDGKERVSSLVSGIAYAGLCITAIKILAGSGGGGGGAKSTTGGVLGWPGGRWLC